MIPCINRKMNIQRVRNFSIIAHIDHGKSTLADRLLEFTGSVSKRNMEEQILDSMDIERERGITIKAQTVRMHYKANDGETYILNMIDTPGHVDFSYEVSRSLAACEGAILIVDAAQGVEAQTLANTYLALENDLEVFPVINKIDLPNADPKSVMEEIEDVIGLDASDAPQISAKTGLHIEKVLEAIVEKIPAPKGEAKAPLQALVFDSWFDNYLGVIALVRVFSGIIKKGQRIRTYHTNIQMEVSRLSFFTPATTETESISCGEVGAVITGLKNLKDIQVGETITCAQNPTKTPLQGFQSTKPMVFSGIYPIDSDAYPALREALEKLQLNDSSLSFEPETSKALGFGFRCGFLGLLHMDVVQERLERGFDLNLITTAPSVVYKVTTRSGEVLSISNPTEIPPVGEIEKIEEPYIQCVVHTPNDYVGQILGLFQARRGTQVGIQYLTRDRVSITYEMPLNEMVFDFHDRLKSATRGYASMDYEPIEYRVGALVKLDIMLNGDVVDALSMIVHKDKSYNRGREITKKLKDIIHRQMFEVAIQATIGAKIISRETLKALRKNVTAKCYGGDITRKRKLLEKQKEGKKRMKQIGSVEIPQDAFLAILKVD